MKFVSREFNWCFMPGMKSGIGSMKGLLVFALILVLHYLAGCSAVYDVKDEYDSTYNFRQLKYYDFVPIKIDSQDETVNIKTIKIVVNNNLKSKGYRQEAATPDFIIAIRFDTQQVLAEPPDPYTLAYSPYTAPPKRYREKGKLVLEFSDPMDQHLIWRGYAIADLSGEKTSEQVQIIIDEAVNRVLERFPPLNK